MHHYLGKRASYLGRKYFQEKIFVENPKEVYIRITETEFWETIDELTTLPKYAKSFNRLINDALFYGLPILRKKELRTVEDEVAEKRAGEHIKEFSESKKETEEELNGIIVQLLRENVLNITIVKSMLSSLFNAKELEYSGYSVSGKKFRQGVFSDTPEYLESYENRGLKKLRG